jgi:hypothetical protein
MTDKQPTMANIKNVVESMGRITDVLPDDPEDALAALIFCLVDVAVKSGVPVEEVRNNIDTAIRARTEAARKAFS